MHSTGPYSFDVMTRVFLDLGPPADHCGSYEELEPSWDEEIRGQSLSLAQSSSILSDFVNALDRQPTGWLPPQYPLSRPNVNQSFLPAPIPIIADLLNFDTFNYGYPNIRQDEVDSTGSESTSSTPTSSAFTRSPSPSVPTRRFSAEFVRGAKDKKNAPELSPFQALREKERKKIRQDSGVKPKAKTAQTYSLRVVETMPSSSPPLEMVQCQWEGCTERLYVDYADVKHWGTHVRKHYADEQDVIQCKWEGGCGSVINKSSMWKHVVAHQPKFKIRCPRGCEVSTRGDMMNRHLKSCHYRSVRVVGEGKSGGEENAEVEEGSYGGDYDGDGEDNEEDKED